MTEKIPNPGSIEAIRQGCTCPILDNNHGIGMKDSTQFWISAGCSLHGKEAYEIFMKNKASELEVVKPVKKKKKRIIDNIVEEMTS